jgi:trigger factor
LPREAVIAANKAPFNLRTGVTKPYDLHYSGAQCEAILGSNRFTTQDQGYGTEMVPIVIDNAPIVGFILTDGHLLLNLNLFDESNNLVLQIVNNAMQLSVDAWDIDLVGQNLIVRQALRNILLDIHFEVPNRIVIRRGRLLRNGVEVLITPDYALVTNNNTFVSGCSAFNVHAGLVLGAGDPPGGAMFRIAGLNRYLGDREASRRWAEQVLRDMSPDSP